VRALRRNTDLENFTIAGTGGEFNGFLNDHALRLAREWPMKSMARTQHDSGTWQTGMAALLKSQVLLIDDHPLMRAGLALLFNQEPDLQVVAEVSNADDAVELVKRTEIDIAVIDVLLPTMSGISLAAQLLEINPRMKILALSAIDEPVMIATMLRAGATGYACKAQPPSEIRDAVRLVLQGVRYLPPRVPESAVLALVENKTGHPFERLTRREREIFELLIRGRSNDEIGSRLFIARRTVETHRQRIMKKLAAHSIIDMIRAAARHGALAD
jgi:DNA-binding NarL/FixJ family response regulator